MKISYAFIYGPLVLFSFFQITTCNTRSLKNADVQKQLTNQRDKTRRTDDGIVKPSSSNWMVKGVTKLTTNLLNDIYADQGAKFNIILSPVSVWTLLLMILEAAAGETEKQLKTGIGMSEMTPADKIKETGRLGYARLKRIMHPDSNGTQFSSVNFLLSDIRNPLAKDYEEIIRSEYNGRHFPIDFKDKIGTAKVINEWAKQATKGRITDVIKPAELTDLSFLIGNAIFFKGKWKYPFNVTLSSLDQFKDDNDQIKNEITMMTQRVILPYGYNTKLESQVVEIPYADDATSMIVILPRKKVRFADVLSKMNNLSLDEIIPPTLTEDEVELYLPRFNYHSNMYLNKVLSTSMPQMFSPFYADLPKLSKDVYVSLIAHRAEIENSEEGTTASSVTSAQVAYKTTTVRFHANRPFIYLINDRKTRTILFAGTLTNPKVV